LKIPHPSGPSSYGEGARGVKGVRRKIYDD